ncbi:hypothetical protein [Nannocystis sp. SCPEA4]|uniref:hypothetical protein n=1 Tax=Nannocystis sp. SCPEA4 TaxID=2996787 RepID=UPI002271F8C7|nr:hypothetical protein [Nannocystis sp. SCPEA4]MCY1055177.1 hypothetical protein [Nannocystis sp. SCPEA4]
MTPELATIGMTARCALLLFVAACNRQPAALDDHGSRPIEPAPEARELAGATADAQPDAAVEPAQVAAAAPELQAARTADVLAPDEGLTKVEPLRPAADEVDRALLLRLRRHSGAALKIEALVRSGDAWLVAYTYDEIDAWWREVHRDGKVAEVRAELRRRRLACEAAFRQPEEDTGTAGDEEPVDDFEVDLENAMDERSCWDRAIGSLAPREGPLDDDCLALVVARVTDAEISTLWSHDGACVEPPAAFELVDVAGAGWPQLVLRLRATRWDVTRLGFQQADTTERMVVLDPRQAAESVMLEQIVDYKTHVDEAWHWEGSYAHVDFKRGRHVTVLEQRWRTSEACQVDQAGWAVAEEMGEEDAFEPCTVEWTMTRQAWDPAAGRWSGKREELPLPKRLPIRGHEL